MPAMVVAFVLVALGGALGAMSRLGMSLLMQRTIVLVPLGTFTSNMIGCLVMGSVVYLLAQADWFDKSELLTEQNRLFFAVGFCGSFTTLSSLIVEMNTLMQRQEFLSAFLYLFATMAGGFVCFYIGILLARSLLQIQAG